MKASTYYGNYEGSSSGNLKLPDPVEDPENTLMRSITSPVKSPRYTPRQSLASPKDSGFFMGGVNEGIHIFSGSPSGSDHFKERYEYDYVSESDVHPGSIIPKHPEFPLPFPGEMTHSLGEYPGSSTEEDNYILGVHPGHSPKQPLHSPVKDPGYTPKHLLTSPLKDPGNMSKSGSLKNKNSIILNQSNERVNVNHVNVNRNTSSSVLTSTRGFESDSVFNFIQTDGKNVNSFDSDKFKLNKNVLFILQKKKLIYYSKYLSLTNILYIYIYDFYYTR